MGWMGKCLSVAAIVFLLSCDTIWAQATAQISGTVKDSSGAVLPGVEITVTQTETAVTRNAVTDETGSYVLPNLAIGPYRFEAALPGFRTYVQTGIVLQVRDSPIINAVLQVGQVTEQVEVQANANLVETRNVGVGQVIENARILELPLNGRQVTDLITLAGGAVQTGVATSQSMQGGVVISVAGGLTYGVTYVLDGAIHDNPWDATNLPLPFPDALQEFKVETSALTAQNGIHSAAAVNAVTKSGTNDFHGDLFEFVRNGKFNARNFFAAKRDTLKRNQFGGTIGGPIVKNKVFFFSGYQGTITRSDPPETISFIPTPAMMQGDFTAFASPACNAGRQLALRAPFVNNQLNPGLFSKAAVNLVNKLPKTNDPCGKITYGVRFGPNEYQILGRLDYQLSERQSIFGRYMATTYQQDPPLAHSDNLLVTGLTGNPGGRDNLAQAFTFRNTYLFNANTVNTFRFAGNRTAIHRFPKGFFSAPDLGVKNFYSYVPDYINVVVTGGFTIGNQTENESRRATSTFQVLDDVSVIHGSHQLAFGGNIANWQSKSNSGAYKQGVFSFTGQATGSGLADLLSGKLTSVNESASSILHSRQWYFGFYGQDTWKLTPRLTLNYGLRWEPFFAQQFTDGHSYHFDHDAFLAGVGTNQAVFKAAHAPAGLFYPGDPGFPGKAGMNGHWLNLNPRVGLAWDLKGDGRTSIRASYGKSSDFVTGSYHLGTIIAAPWAARVFANSPSGGFDDPWSDYPGGNPFPTGPALYPYFTFYQNMKYNTHTPYVQSWNLSIQRQIGSDWLLSTAYLGNHTVHLWGAREINPGTYIPGGPCTIAGVVYNPCTSTTNTDQRRRLNLEKPSDGQYYASVNEVDDGLTSGYHGLELSLQRRVSKGVAVNGNYTWSHCIAGDPQMTNPSIGYVDPTNRKFDVANCSQDRRHIFNMTALAGSPTFVNPVLRTLASNWQLSPILRISTGASLTALSGRDNAFTGINLQRPNQILGNPYGDRSSVNRYLNPAAFAQPAAGTNGNMRRANIAGPGTWGLDMTLSRMFQIRENQRVEIRAEAFNVTNSLRRGNPDMNLVNSIFGQITTAADPRIMQFALKYVF